MWTNISYSIFGIIAIIGFVEVITKAFHLVDYILHATRNRENSVFFRFNFRSLFIGLVGLLLTFIWS